MTQWWIPRVLFFTLLYLKLDAREVCNPEMAGATDQKSPKKSLLHLVKGLGIGSYRTENVFSSVVQSCLTLWDPMNCSTPSLSVYHQLPEFTQTHVHWVGDAIQPSHPSVVPFSSCPQSFPASGSFQMSQFFASGGHSVGVSASTSVLPMNTQDWSPLGWTGWISLQFRDSQEFSPTPQLKSINSSVLSFLHSPTLTSIHDYWKNHSLWLEGPLLTK